jgi:hypothetical protein
MDTVEQQVQDALDDIPEVGPDEPHEQEATDPHSELINTVLSDQALTVGLQLSRLELQVLDELLSQAAIPDALAKIVSGFLHAKVRRARGSVLE